MTIYGSTKTPAWDKSGERRMGMNKQERAKFQGAMPKMAHVVQARDGRWVYGNSSNREKLAQQKRGDFLTAPEAVAAASAEGFDIITNTAPAVAAPKKSWSLEPAPHAKKLVEADYAELETRAAAHAAGKATGAGTGRKQSPPLKAGGGRPCMTRGGAQRGKGIGAFCEGLILEGKTDEQVLAACRAQFPDAATKEASVKWYRNKLAKEGRLK